MAHLDVKQEILEIIVKKHYNNKECILTKKAIGKKLGRKIKHLSRIVEELEVSGVLELNYRDEKDPRPQVIFYIPKCKEYLQTVYNVNLRQLLASLS